MLDLIGNVFVSAESFGVDSCIRLSFSQTPFECRMKTNSGPFMCWIQALSLFTLECSPFCGGGLLSGRKVPSGRTTSPAKPDQPQKICSVHECSPSSFWHRAPEFVPEAEAFDASRRRLRQSRCSCHCRLSVHVSTASLGLARAVRLWFSKIMCMSGISNLGIDSQQCLPSYWNVRQFTF